MGALYRNPAAFFSDDHYNGAIMKRFFAEMDCDL